MRAADNSTYSRADDRTDSGNLPIAVRHNDGNDGSSAQPLYSLSVAAGRASAGTTICMAGEAYNYSDTVTLSRAGTSSNPIRIEPLSGSTQRITLDLGFAANTWEQDAFGLYVTGSYWYIKGVDVTRAGYQGGYVTGSHNTFEFCRFYDNRNSGIEFNEGGAYTTLINCDSFKNYDPKKYGSMADGFGPKQTSALVNRGVNVGLPYSGSAPDIGAFETPY
jgi:hypothetical protein